MLGLTYDKNMHFTDYGFNVSVMREMLYTIAISLNLSLVELTLYLWTMSKGLVTFSNSATHATAEKASLVRARSSEPRLLTRAVAFTEILRVADPVILKSDILRDAEISLSFFFYNAR